MLRNNQRPLGRHEDLILAIMFVVGGLIILFASIIYYDLGIQDEINELNCRELQQWVLDLKPKWSYAEHRFEWLSCEKENDMS